MGVFHVARVRRGAFSAVVLAVAVVGLCLPLAPAAIAQEPGLPTEPPYEGAWHPPIVPAPVPFSLNSYDVIDAVWLLRRVDFVHHWDHESRPRIIPVRTAQSYWVDYDPDAYEAHQNRYSILLNGEPIEWDHIYVEYNHEMVNLRLLYTYRNQKPPPDLPYRLVWP